MRAHDALPELFKHVNDLRYIEASNLSAEEIIRAYKAIIGTLKDDQVYQIAAFLMHEHNNDDIKQTPKNKKDHNFIRIRTLTRLLYIELANRVQYDPSDLANDVPDVMNKLNWYVLRNTPISENVSDKSNAIGNIYFTRDPEKNNWLSKLSDEDLKKRFTDDIEYARKNLEYFKVNVQQQLDPGLSDRERIVKLIFEIEKVRAQNEKEYTGKIINDRVTQQENPNKELIDAMKQSAISANIDFLTKLSQNIQKTTGERNKLDAATKSLAGNDPNTKDSSPRAVTDPVRGSEKKKSIFAVRSKSMTRLPVKENSKQVIRENETKIADLDRNIKNCKESYLSTLKSVVTSIENHPMDDPKALHGLIMETLSNALVLHKQLPAADSMRNELKDLAQRMQQVDMNLNFGNVAAVEEAPATPLRSSKN